MIIDYHQSKESIKRQWLSIYKMGYLKRIPKLRENMLIFIMIQTMMMTMEKVLEVMMMTRNTKRRMKKQNKMLMNITVKVSNKLIVKNLTDLLILKKKQKICLFFKSRRQSSNKEVIYLKLRKKEFRILRSLINTQLSKSKKKRH